MQQTDLANDPEVLRFAEGIQQGMIDCGRNIVISNAQESAPNPCENFDPNIEYQIRQINPDLTPKPDGPTMI